MGTSPARLGPESPEMQGSGSGGPSGWREKAEDCPQKSLEVKGAGDGAGDEKGLRGGPDTTVLTWAASTKSAAAARGFLESVHKAAVPCSSQWETVQTESRGWPMDLRSQTPAAGTAPRTPRLPSEQHREPTGQGQRGGVRTDTENASSKPKPTKPGHIK